MIFNHFYPKKIMIFGRTGGGKSTFAIELANILELPVYHLDKYFFESNWKERNYQEFLKAQQSIIEQSQWIIDGNSIKSLELRFSKADMVLYFNYPRWICYIRVFKRLFYKDFLIDDRAPGCSEKIRTSLLHYMWDFEERVNHEVLRLKGKYPNPYFLEIRNVRQLNQLRRELTQKKRQKES